MKKKKAPSTLNRYLEKLSLAADDLAGKRILDIGGGGLYFSREAELACGAKVFSVDKDLSEAKTCYANWQWQAELYHAQSRELNAFETCLKRSAWALAQNLPFRDEVFDLVVSVNTVPLLFDSYLDILRVLHEALRVTKQGGAIRLHPLEPLWRPGAPGRVGRIRMVDQALHVLIEKQRGVRITLVPVENDDPITGSGVKIISRFLIMEKN